MKQENASSSASNALPLAPADEGPIIRNNRLELARLEVERLKRIIAWYWRNHGPYPTALDQSITDTPQSRSGSSDT